MNAKDRANFINSMQTNPSTNTVCAACGSVIIEGDKFCGICGAVVALNVANPSSRETPFNKVREPAVKANVKASTASPAQQTNTYEEPANVFALGLPEWSIEPPQVMVRRKRKI